MLRKKILATVGILLLCYAAVEAARFWAGPRAEFFLDQRVSRRSKGNPGAPLWIVEYVDFQCRTCRSVGPLLRSYLARYPSHIYLQVRFRPLVLSHPLALKSALYAECAAAQGKFWAFHDLVFDRQDEWVSSSDPDARLTAYARAAGMDLKKLEACVQDPVTKHRVIAEKDEAVDLGIRSTPSFFVNGRMIVGLEAFERELEAYFFKQKGRSS